MDFWAGRSSCRASIGIRCGGSHRLDREPLARAWRGEVVEEGCVSVARSCPKLRRARARVKPQAWCRARQLPADRSRALRDARIHAGRASRTQPRCWRGYALAGAAAADSRAGHCGSSPSCSDRAAGPCAARSLRMHFPMVEIRISCVEHPPPIALNGNAGVAVGVAS